MIKFRKMHGLGNDFVIVDGRNTAISLKKEQIATMADRHRGIGCDQFIVMEPSDHADVFMRIYNPDGGQAQACGNATRCVADIIMNEKGGDACVIQTVAGLLACTRDDKGLVTVDMGVPRLNWDQIPLAQACDTLHVPLSGDPVAVNIGNPHAVFFVDDVNTYDVAGVGSLMEIDPMFPEKTNVEFVEVKSQHHLRMCVWERGAGITQACGSGACAVAVAAVRRGLTARKVTITLDGGDLVLEWRESDGHIYMTGPVAYVFEGEWA